MSNILLLSENKLLADDLAEQIKLAEPEFDIFGEDDKAVHFDIIIVDEDTAALKTALQQKVPVFFLTSEDEAGVAVNHIFSKPFHLSALIDDLRGCINRFENSSDGFLRFNCYELRPISKEIINLNNDKIIKQTEKEVAVIKYLYKTKDHIVSKNELLQEVWGYSPEVSTHTIETHIYRLRQKVEHDNPEAQLILTEDGGYKLKF